MGTTGLPTKRLLAVWVSAAGSVLAAGALAEGICPDPSDGAFMLLWSLFLVTPGVYTLLLLRDRLATRNE